MGNREVVKKDKEKEKKIRTKPQEEGHKLRRDSKIEGKKKKRRKNNQRRKARVERMKKGEEIG